MAGNFKLTHYRKMRQSSQKSIFGRKTLSHRLKDDRLSLPPDHQILEIFPALLGRTHGDIICLHEYRPKRPPAGRPAQEHAKAALMEAMRTTRLRPIGHKRQLQMIDNPIHDGNLRDEGDDLHPAPAFRADHRVHLIG